MIRKLITVAIFIALVFPVLTPIADEAEAGVSCWVYRNMGNHPLAWDLCMLEIWAASGFEQVPDPGEGGTSGGAEW
jgi:hypothetical protein